MLMAGVVSLANASNILQVSFAAAYILLNALYWAVSALNPCKYHWQHAYRVKVLPIEPVQAEGPMPSRPHGKIKEWQRTVKQEWKRLQDAWVLSKRRETARKRAQTVADPGSRNFTGALWTAIVLTGTSQWLNEATTIAPMSPAWREWLQEAERRVQPNIAEGETPGSHNDDWEERYTIHRRPRIATGLDWNFTYATTANAKSASRKRRIRIKSWKYQEALTAILQKHAAQSRVPVGDEILDPGGDGLGSRQASGGLSPTLEV